MSWKNKLSSLSKCSLMSQLFRAQKFATVVQINMELLSSKITSLSWRETQVKDNSVLQIIISFKDQISANAVSITRLALLWKPVVRSKKSEQDLKPNEIKSPVVN